MCVFLSLEMVNYNFTVVCMSTTNLFISNYLFKNKLLFNLFTGIDKTCKLYVLLVLSFNYSFEGRVHTLPIQNPEKIIINNFHTVV